MLAKEGDPGYGRKMTVCLLEMVGTALFVYGILINGADNAGVALSLFASVILLGGITGGHFNPAVTLGIYIQSREYVKNLFFMIQYIIAQIIGGLIAVAMAYPSLYDSKTGKPSEAWTAHLCPKNTFDSVDCDGAIGHFHLTLKTLVNEIVCTFIFVSVILMITSSK
jgi:aquaporin Z